jgi:hypothetical protein
VAVRDDIDFDSIHELLLYTGQTLDIQRKVPTGTDEWGQSVLDWRTLLSAIPAYIDMVAGDEETGVTPDVVVGDYKIIIEVTDVTEYDRLLIKGRLHNITLVNNKFDVYMEIYTRIVQRTG